MSGALSQSLRNISIKLTRAARELARCDPAKIPIQVPQAMGNGSRTAAILTSLATRA
jgi:hypothetical protein